MAKNIVVRWEGEESAFPFVKVERDKLYGSKERVIVDEQGRTCSSAWLTADGSALVLAGGTAHVNVDDAWTAYEQDERRAVDLEGRALETQPSTLGVAQDLVEASVDRLLDCTTSVVYQLETDGISASLLAALSSGTIFEAPFLYRDGLSADSVFLVKNDEGVFALVGRPTGFDFVKRDALPEPETAEREDELDADLDFSMM
jgi:hypothetical protein